MSKWFFFVNYPFKKNYCSLTKRLLTFVTHLSRKSLFNEFIIIYSLWSTFCRLFASLNPLSGVIMSCRFRMTCKNIITHKMFDHVVLVIIFLNCITIAMERPRIDPSSAVSNVTSHTYKHATESFKTTFAEGISAQVIEMSVVCLFLIKNELPFYTSFYNFYTVLWKEDFKLFK